MKKHKFVEFNRYCKDCKYKDNKEEKEPCDKCLLEPVNIDTRKPICFERK